MIRVNTIAPDGVETEGVLRIGIIGSDFEKEMVSNTPRWTGTEDNERAEVFWPPKTPDGVTGERIEVSGGYRRQDHAR